MNKIFMVFKKEIREILREKKSLKMMFIIPIMIPLIIIGISYLFESQMNQNINEYNKIGINYSLSDIEKEIIKETKIDVVYEEKETLEKEYDKENIYAYIIKENNNYTIYYDEQNEKSSMAQSLVISYLESYKLHLQNEYLSINNIDSNEVINIINIKMESLEKENFFAEYIIGYSFIFLITAITTSAIYSATDITAGEKERGTLETILTFPIQVKELIIGKFLAISTSSFITGLVSLILTVISLFICQNKFSIYEGSSLMLTLTSIIIIIIIILAYSLFISGLTIAIASKTKSYKEAQSALTPLSFIAMFPSLILFMMEIKSGYLLSIIPFVNFSMIINDIAVNNLNIIHAILMFISTIIYICLIIIYIIKQYNKEEILFVN